MKAEPEEDDPNDSYEARAMKRKIAKKRAQEVVNCSLVFDKLFVFGLSFRQPLEPGKMRDWQCWRRKQNSPDFRRW